MWRQIQPKILLREREITNIRYEFSICMRLIKRMGKDDLQSIIALNIELLGSVGDFGSWIFYVGDSGELYK